MSSPDAGGSIRDAVRRNRAEVAELLRQTSSLRARVSERTTSPARSPGSPGSTLTRSLPRVRTSGSEPRAGERSLATVFAPSDDQLLALRAELAAAQDDARFAIMLLDAVTAHHHHQHAALQPHVGADVALQLTQSLRESHAREQALRVENARLARQYNALLEQVRLATTADE